MRWLRSRGALRVGLCTAILALALSRAPGASPTQPTVPLPRELAWIGLFNGELVGWLENENRLDEFALVTRAPESHECRTAYMEPKVAVIALRPESMPGAWERLFYWPHLDAASGCSPPQAAWRDSLPPDEGDGDYGDGQPRRHGGHGGNSLN